MGGFNFNPVLSEIQGHLQSMSPDAQAVVAKMGGNTLPTPSATTAASAPSALPPGTLLPHHEAEPPQGNISMGSPAPTLSMPSDQPSIAAPRGTIQGDTSERSRILSTGSGISQIGSKIENSRLGEAHPFLGKLLGGLAQGAATVGDIGLSAVAPEIAINTPGTEYHHQALLNHATGALSQDVGNAQKEAQTANENATAQHTAAETSEVAPEAEGRIGLEQAQASEAPSVIAEHNAQAANLLHPQAKTDFEAWQQQNPGKPIEDWLKAQNQNKTITPEQQYLNEYAQRHPGSTIADATKAYKADSQAPQRAPIVNMFVPGATPGTETLQTVRPGQTVAAGAQTAAGVNSVNTPTTQQRTAAGRAETVVAMAPEVLSRIDALAPKLGPIGGRWNEFMQGKVGADDPDFAALRSDLLMMSSAVALAHAQGRLPENLREEFDRAINSPKQTPENLKATIQTMIPWLTQMQKQGQPNASQGNAQPQVMKFNPATGRLE